MEVIEPERCEACGRYMPIPADGRYRFSQSGKTFATAAKAQTAAARITLQREGWEAIAAQDAQGRHRIATRRELHAS